MCHSSSGMCGVDNLEQCHDSVENCFQVAFLHVCRLLLAVGLESGAIMLYSCCCAATLADSPGSPGTFWCPLLTLPSSLAHTSTVKRLQWRPRTRMDSEPPQGAGSTVQEQCQSGERAGSTDAVRRLKLMLASCSTDHTVKLYSIISK